MTNVYLTPEMKQFVNDSVLSGRYRTGSEVVRAAMRLLMQEAARDRAMRDEVAARRRVG